VHEVNALSSKNNGDISVTARCCLGISGALSFVLRERFFTASVPRLGKRLCKARPVYCGGQS
jgi:hypothetical protein